MTTRLAWVGRYGTTVPGPEYPSEGEAHAGAAAFVQELIANAVTVDDITQIVAGEITITGPDDWEKFPANKFIDYNPYRQVGLMGPQDVLCTVLRHLRQQGRRAADSRGQCYYRTPEGLRCAIGCRIPDERYTPEIEGVRFSPAHGDFPCENRAIKAEYLLPDVACTAYSLLADLQDFHDSWWDPSEPLDAGENLRVLERIVDDHNALQEAFGGERLDLEAALGRSNR